MMLEVFYNEFYGWGYTGFDKLNQYIRQTFKESLKAKEIYIGQLSGYIN